MNCDSKSWDLSSVTNLAHQTAATVQILLGISNGLSWTGVHDLQLSNVKLPKGTHWRGCWGLGDPGLSPEEAMKCVLKEFKH